MTLGRFAKSLWHSFEIAVTAAPVYTLKAMSLPRIFRKTIQIEGVSVPIVSRNRKLLLSRSCEHREL